VATYFIALLAVLAVLLQLPLLPEPSAFRPASIPIATSAAIRLYSIAVAPRSSRANLREYRRLRLHARLTPCANANSCSHCQSRSRSIALSGSSAGGIA